MLARTPSCTITEKRASGFTGSVFATFERSVCIEGPTKESVQEAIRAYKTEHAACEPPPCFGFILLRDGKFVVGGWRGEDPRK